MRTWIAVVLFAAAVCGFFFDVVFQDRVLLTANPAAYLPWRAYAGDAALAGKTYRTDSVLTYLPRRDHLSGSIARGRLPLWNPYILGGVPFLADPQSQVLYPPALALVPFGAEKAIGYGVAVHILLALTGMYLFLRAISAGAAGSMLGAVAYGFSSFFFTRMGHPTFVASAAWLPFLFYGFELARRQKRAGVLALAAFLALGYLAGFPQVLVFAVAALVVYALLVALDGDGLPLRGAGGRALASARIIAIGGGISLLAVGIHLVPFLEYLRNSFGLGIPWAEMSRLHLSSPAMLARAVFPNAFGNPVQGTNWLPLVRPGIHPFNPGFLVYCGAGTLVLALAGLAYLRRSARLRALYVLLAASCLIATSGLALRAVYAAVPLFRYSQIDRVSVVACFALAALAGKTLSLALSDAGAASRRRFALALVFSAVVAAASAGLVLGGWGALARVTHGAASNLQGLPSAGSDVVRGWLGGGRADWLAYERRQVLQGLGAVLVSLVLAGLCLAGRRKRLSAAAPWLLVAWVAADLMLVARTYYVSQPSPALRETEGIRRLQELTAEQAWRVGSEGADPVALPPNTNQIFGLASLDGRSTIMPLAHGYLLRAALESGALRDGRIERGVAPRSDLAALLSTRYVLASQSGPAEGERVVYHGDMVVCENPSALPRAICVDRHGLAAMNGERGPVIAVAGRLGEVAGLQCGVARLDAFRPERIEIAVEADRDCYLLLADTYYPGWTAMVDGGREDIMMTDVGTRALAVAAGRHRVEMEFRPRSLTIGFILTCLGIVIGIAYGLRARYTAGQ